MFHKRILLPLIYLAVSNSSGAALLAAMGWAIATGLVDPSGRGKTRIAWAFPRPQDFMKKLAAKGQESWAAFGR